MDARSRSGRTCVASVSGPGAMPFVLCRYQGVSVSSAITAWYGIPLRAQKSMYVLCASSERMGGDVLPGSTTLPFHHGQVIFPGRIHDVSPMAGGSFRQ